MHLDNSKCTAAMLQRAGNDWVNVNAEINAYLITEIRKFRITLN